MRICIPAMRFFKGHTLPDAIRGIAQMGFDAAEVTKWAGLDLAGARAACEETGVEFLSICTTDFGLTISENRTHYLECLRESCAAAKLCGAKFLITQGGPDTGEDRFRQHDSIIAGLRAARPIVGG